MYDNPHDLLRAVVLPVGEALGDDAVRRVEPQDHQRVRQHGHQRQHQRVRPAARLVEDGV